MNLVIDDAVEVRQATKTEEEKRRPLGMHPVLLQFASEVQWSRTILEKIEHKLTHYLQVKFCSKATMSL